MPNPPPNHYRQPELARLSPRDREALHRWYRAPDESVPITPADVPDFVRNSWRWNNREALEYELNQAIEKRDSARRAEELAGKLGWAGLAAGAAAEGKFGRGGPMRRVGGLLSRSGPGAAVALVGSVAARDRVQFGRRAIVLEERLRQLPPRP